MNAKRSLYASIKRRCDRLIEHTLRLVGLAATILVVTIEGYKKKRRQRLEYVKQIIDEVGCSRYGQMKRLTQDRNG